MKFLFEESMDSSDFIKQKEIERYFGKENDKLMKAQFQLQNQIQQMDTEKFTLSIKLSPSGFNRQLCRFTGDQLHHKQWTFISQSQCLINKDKQNQSIKVIFQHEKIQLIKQLQISLKNKSPLLNEITSIKQIQGIIFDLCQQNMGSRIIQKLIHLSSRQTIETLQKQISSQYHILMKDKYGNYIIQKIFYHLDELEKISFLKNISPNIVNVAKTKFGTHCLQYLIRKCFKFQQCVKVIEDSIKDNVSSLSMDEYGTHFVQQMINYGKSKTVQNHFYQAENLQKISKSKYGILVIKALMARICPSSKGNTQKRISFLNTIYNSFNQIATNEYSHFQLQELPKYYQSHELNWVLWSISSNLAYLSANHYSSSVICTFLQYYSHTWVNPLVHNIFSSQEIVLSLLQTKSGSFLMHRLLDLADVPSRGAMKKTLLSLTDQIVSAERKTKWKKFLKGWSNCWKIQLREN